jgi:hypothetical protein
LESGGTQEHAFDGWKLLEWLCENARVTLWSHKQTGSFQIHSFPQSQRAGDTWQFFRSGCTLECSSGMEGRLRYCLWSGVSGSEGCRSVCTRLVRWAWDGWSTAVNDKAYFEYSVCWLLLTVGSVF